MKNYQLKEILYNKCKEFVDTKLATIENTIKSNQKALSSETKSSAGDKHETGRAMLQLEMEKAGQQLGGILEMKTILSKIDLRAESTHIKLGNIVKTSEEAYFISISAGRIDYENTIFYAISSHSPIGKLLLGKKINQEIDFNNKKIRIQSIL